MLDGSRSLIRTALVVPAAELVDRACRTSAASKRGAHLRGRARDACPARARGLVRHRARRRLPPRPDHLARRHGDRPGAPLGRRGLASLASDADRGSRRDSSAPGARPRCRRRPSLIRSSSRCSRSPATGSRAIAIARCSRWRGLERSGAPSSCSATSCAATRVSL